MGAICSIPNTLHVVCLHDTIYINALCPTCCGFAFRFCLTLHRVVQSSSEAESCVDAFVSVSVVPVALKIEILRIYYVCFVLR